MCECVGLRSRAYVWSLSSLVLAGGRRPATQGGENNLPHSFFPKLWFRQQPLGVTVPLASNDRQGQGRAGVRAVGHVVLAAHLDPNRIVYELWLLS